MTESTAAQRASKQADKDAIRPFQANFPETELTELRGRINATNGRNGRQSRMRRKACSSQQFKHSRATGGQNTFFR